MASVGRLLLVLFFCASTAPTLTSAQPIIGLNIPRIISQFYPVPGDSNGVAHVAIQFYNFNRIHSSHLQLPQLFRVYILEVSFAAAVFRGGMIMLYRTTFAASLGAQHGAPWRIVVIYFGMLPDLLPAFPNGIPGTSFVKIHP
ncbi:hypothetical protein AXF42_Ash007815 [Apostasia shenzhenica]|uniref:Uncharacterized protein n=1 Tax=Apostasia shenzhenica TaxID=1088818 RepID=A0A2I0B5E4_9ASPA|nr:hypothetical protein AXF42_Ash007815 [Apostasia shenzhenica]